jgi:hypothetical protein
MGARSRSFIVFAVLSIACGGQTREAAAPGEPPVAEDASAAESAAPVAAPAETAPSSTLDKDEHAAQSLSDAVSEFDRARLELSQLLGRELEPREPGPADGASAPVSDAPKSQAPPAPAREKRASRAEAEGSQARPLKKGDDGCVNVCRAFDSLTRSAAAVCRLDDGERCRRAHAVVAVAQDDAGVKACACKK